MAGNCTEPNCLARLVNSARAKCMSINELIGNVFCVLKTIASGINAINDKFEEFIDAQAKYSWHFEVWSFTETVTVSKRPVDFIPLTGTLTKFIFTFKETPDDPGVNPIEFNVLLDNVVIATIVSSVAFYELEIDLGVMKGQYLEIQVTDAPDIPSDDANWKGLSVYFFETEA